MATLVGRGLLARNDPKYPTLSVTSEGRRFLKNRENIELPVLESTKRASIRASAELDYDDALFQKLRQLRTRLASERGVPPYVVFGDVSLREMAHYYPQSQDSFLKITGVGRVKLNDFGDEFLDTIRAYAEPKGIEDRTVAAPSERPRESRMSSDRRKTRDSGMNSSLKDTLSLLQQGLPFQEVVNRRGLARSTISTHIEWLIQSGDLEDCEAYLPDAEDLARITESFERLGDERLRPVHDALSGEIAYWKIRLARAHYRRQSSA